MPRLFVPVLAVFLAVAVTSGDAIKCYVCNSQRDYTCGDPFFYGHFPQIDCDHNPNMRAQSQPYQERRSVCKKTITRANNGIAIIDRSCAIEGSYSNTDPCALGGSGYNERYASDYLEHCSVCRYDGCNGAAGITPTFWVLVTSSILFAAAKCL